MREFAAGVSYAKFAGIARRKDWSVEHLAEFFRGKIETMPHETLPSYFRRVLECDPSPDNVIPYRSVIRRYLEAVHDLKRDGKLRTCACGCGSYPGEGRRLAWDSCVEPKTDAQKQVIEALAKARRRKSQGAVRV